MTWTFLFLIFHAFNISPVVVVIDSHVFEPRNCLACSTAFHKVKLKSILCAIRLYNDVGHISVLQMSVV